MPRRSPVHETEDRFARHRRPADPGACLEPRPEVLRRHQAGGPERQGGTPLLRPDEGQDGGHRRHVHHLHWRLSDDERHVRQDPGASRRPGRQGREPDLDLRRSGQRHARQAQGVLGALQGRARLVFPHRLEGERRRHPAQAGSVRREPGGPSEPVPDRERPHRPVEEGVRPGQAGGDPADRGQRGERQGRGVVGIRILGFLFLFLAPACLQAAAPPSAEQKQQLERGRRIYVEGTSPSGGEITALMSDASVEVPASAVPCAGCHGRDGKGRPEGGLSPSDLTWTTLTRPYGVTSPSGRKHPPYDAKLLKRAISLGLDPAGNPLHVAMPRFRMSLKDMDDLLAYLQQLGTESDPGVGGGSLRVGVILPPAGPLSGMGKALRAALTARFDALNKEGGIYGRQVEPRFLEAPGPPEQRRAWTADFLQREEVFAGVAAFLAGADAELAGLFQEKRIPLVGPFTVHPRETFPLNRYVFYLLPGGEIQGQALARFIRVQAAGKPVKAAVVAPEEAGLNGAVEAIRKAAAGWPAPAVVRYGRQGVESEAVSRLAAAKLDPVFFFGSGPEARSFLQAADRLGWRPRILATGTAADGSLFGSPAAFDGRIYLALPSPPGDPAPQAAADYRALAATYKLPQDSLSAQLSALAAAETLIEALKRAGRDLSREKLVDQLESLRAFQTGLAPPLTYGPTRRLGARGAYVMRLDLKGKRLVPEG